MCRFIEPLARQEFVIDETENKYIAHPIRWASVPFFRRIIKAAFVEFSRRRPHHSEILNDRGAVIGQRDTRRPETGVVDSGAMERIEPLRDLPHDAGLLQ